MATTRQIWVSPSKDNGWKIHKPGTTRVSGYADTKLEAVKIAQKIARNQGLETKIQKMDGTIQGGNSYGNDPFPPRDTN